MAGWFSGLGSLSFCEGRFASFAALGPFSNGPYGVAGLVFSDGGCGMVVPMFAKGVCGMV